MEPKTKKETPLLLCQDMVRAFLEGRKTQTRRIVKPPLPDNPTEVGGQRWGLVDGSFYYCGRKCPYGQPGDLLWFKEKWAVREWYTLPNYLQEGYRATIEYAADGHIGQSVMEPDWEYEHHDSVPEANPTGWRSSMFMPKWACRLWAELVDVKPPERINAISFTDIVAEGIDDEHRMGQGASVEQLRSRYHILWDSLHGPGAWERNDWVWPLVFRRIDKP